MHERSSWPVTGACVAFLLLPGVCKGRPQFACQTCHWNGCYWNGYWELGARSSGLFRGLEDRRMRPAPDTEKELPLSIAEGLRQ